MAVTEFIKNDFKDILSKEWLLCNGIGGYASSSLCGANTRKYHGLLVAALNPPTNRQVLVSKIEEAILLENDVKILLAVNQYPNAIYPEGYRYLDSFDRIPVPTFIYKTKTYALEKNVFMPYGHNATIVEYKNIGDIPLRLKLNPLFSHRGYHSLFYEDSKFEFYSEIKDNEILTYAKAEAMPLYWKFTKGVFQEERCWYKNLQYYQEMFRGLEFQEDAYQIGNITVELKPGESVHLIFSLDKSILDQSPEKLKEKEIERLKKLVPKEVKNTFYQDLIVSADQFMVHRKSTECFSIIAGYHWFTDWGRDTMITMLGATIALGKKAETESIMSTFLKYLDEGMVPNRFPDAEGEEPEYNTVDATLWLFVALYEYHQKFKDVEFIRSVYPFLGEILNHHIKGTRYNIHVTDKGFLWAGDDTTQLTWMDARINDYSVTPRCGCAVEINALWYNALKIYESFTIAILEKPDVDVKPMIKKFNTYFETAFWNSDGYLNDIYCADDKIDTALRPNQLYAVSLPFPLLSKKKQKLICEKVKKYLLTPLGLRSLSPEHPLFRPVYEGDQWSRDTAYHQGTVWAFLISEYMMAHLSVNDYSAQSKKDCKEIIEGFKQHFYHESGIHCISEIFDGLNPYDGKGCIQQAWSVAALLRVLDKTGMLFEK